MLRRLFTMCFCLTLLATGGCILFGSSREKVEVDVSGVFTNATRIEKIYFDFNKYEIRGEGKKALLNLVERMKEDAGITLIVIGHTDSRGTEEYNLALGERRANAVREFIVGCDRSLASRVSTQSRGKAEPEILVYSSDFKEAERAHAQNRRVVVVIEHSQAPSKNKSQKARWRVSKSAGTTIIKEESADGGGGVAVTADPDVTDAANSQLPVVVDPEELEEMLAMEEEED
ncbi:MAG: OmpA family protein [Anaplasma sp.]